MTPKLIVPDDRKRTYDLFTLDNKLEVITISDPATTTSSAALEVSVGSMSDPDDLAGLAHFIEHMLFLGTEKYPQESSYQDFLSEHGGHSNASTSLEYTNFYFTVTSDHLREALDRFSAFFTCPLFTQSATDREMNAIESEHSKNIQNDGFRFYQFLKDTSNPDYAFSKFSTGNLVTLKEQPAAKGVDTRAEMIKHYQAYYSANLMKLVVYGKESNAELQDWVKELFLGIPNKDYAVPAFEGTAYTGQQLMKWYHIVPVKTQRTLVMHFPLDVGHEEYLTKESRYFGHLIGHESEGSILYVLKEKGWAESLCAGTGFTMNTWSLFTIDIEMTKEGLDHMEEMVDIVFQYINMLKDAGTQEAVYAEIKNLAEMQFRYMEPSRPEHFCTDLARSMTTACGAHALAAHYLFFEYSPARIDRMLAALRTDNMNVYVKCQELEGTCDRTISPWYHIKYSERPLSAAQIARWNGLPTNAALHLPSTNPFIPESMDLKPLPDNAPDHPRLIHETPATEPGVRLWFQQDNHYLKPKATTLWALLTPLGYCSPRHRVLNRLMCMVVMERLNALSYHASVANLQYALAPSFEGLNIIVTGFNDKVGVFMKEVFTYLKNVQVDDALFLVMRDQLKKMLENFFKEQAYQIAMEGTKVCFMTPRWGFADTLPIVDQVTLPELQQHIALVLQQFSVEAYFQGNLLEADALQIMADAKATLLQGVLPMPSNQLPCVREGKIPKGREWVRPLPCPTADGTNSALHMTMQVGLRTPRAQVLSQVFTSVTQSIFFTQLRTLESLGYIVAMIGNGSEPGRAVGTAGVSCIVQSATHDPLYLYARVYGFFEALGPYLEEYKEADFKEVVASLIAKKREKPKTLDDDAGRKWAEIQEEQYMWDRRERQIKELEGLTKADLLELYRSRLANDAPKRRRLTTLIFASQHQALYDDAVRDAEGSVVKRAATRLPEYRASNSAARTPEVEAFLAALPAEIAAVLQKMPADGLQELAGGVPAEELAAVPVEAVQEMVDAKVQEGAEGLAKSPLPAIEKYNAAPPEVELAYILDAGRWKQTLKTFPALMPAQA